MPGSKKTAEEKKLLFADYYAATWNITKAAIKAGYAKSTASATGSRLLNDSKVQSRVKQRIDEAIQDIDVEVARWWLGVKSIQDANILDYVSWDEKGNITLKSSSKITREQAHPIYSITQTISRAGKKVTVKLEGKLKAYELAGRALGIFGDEKHLSRRTKKDNKTAEEKRKQLSKLLSRRQEINDKRSRT